MSTETSDHATTPPSHVGRGASAADRIRARWQRLPVAWRRSLVAALLLRSGIGLFSLTFGGLLPGLDPVGVTPVPSADFAGWSASSTAAQGAGLLGASLERFDALWYLAIASDGYPDLLPGGGLPQAAAFFPGLPLLIALLGFVLGGHHYLAGSLVALAATVAAFAGLHRLIEEEVGDPVVARRALVAAAVFPSAFFLVAPYTESLFLATSVWALVWARRGRWRWVAPLALYTGLTRNVGVLLAVALALEAWRQHREGRSLGANVAAGILAAPAGLGLFALYGWWKWGDLLATVSVQSGWQREFTWPWVTLARAVDVAVSTPGRYATGYHTLDLLLFLPVLAAVWWLVRRAPATYSVYAVAHLAIWLVYPFPDRPLMSTPRFALAVAPIFWAFAVWTRGEGRAATWWAASAALLGVQTLLFVDWYYIF